MLSVLCKQASFAILKTKMNINRTNSKTLFGNPLILKLLVFFD